MDFALNAFWVAAWGVVVTVAIWAYFWFKGVSAQWTHALAGSFVALVFVLLVTGALVIVKRRASLARSTPVQTGRKGFLDYKRDGSRATAKILSSTTHVGTTTERIGEAIAASGRRIDTIRSKSGADIDERAYQEAEQTARRISKLAGILDVHAKEYASATAVFVESYTNWMSWLQRQEVVDKDEMETYAQALTSLYGIFQQNLPIHAQFRANVERIREVNQHMDVAGGLLVAALDTIVMASKNNLDFCASQATKARQLAARTSP